MPETLPRALVCPSCGKRSFHARHRPAEKAKRVLWVKYPAKAERLELECLRCGWETEMALGTVRASDDVSLEFDIVG